MNILEIKKQINIEKIKSNLNEYFGNDNFKVENYNRETELTEEISIDDRDDIFLLTIKLTESFNKEITIFPITLRVALGKNMSLIDGLILNQKIIFDLEYDKELNLISISW